MGRGAQRIILVTHERKPAQFFYAGNNDRDVRYYFEGKQVEFPESKGYTCRAFKQVKIKGIVQSGE